MKKIRKASGKDGFGQELGVKTFLTIKMCKEVSLLEFAFNERNGLQRL